MNVCEVASGLLPSLDNPQPGTTLAPVEEMGQGDQQLSEGRQTPCHPRTISGPSRTDIYYTHDTNKETEAWKEVICPGSHSQ